jgi:tetratricopeptide (TPR) repeat protein
VDANDPEGRARQVRLDEVLAEYLQGADRGEPGLRRRILEEHPDLADDLRSYFEGSDELSALAVADPSSTDAAGEPGREDPPAEGAADPSGGAGVRYFGDYLLIEEIGRGGMGLVYRARQASLRRPVALKLILSGRFAAPRDVQRFRIEAEAAAGLDHPNIVPIYEVGEHQGWHYYSMRLMEGDSLASPSIGAPIEPRRAARLVAKVARAVHFAHERGILHRDLKPANVLLDDRGEPHVVDFGLAKRLGGDGDLTGSETILGTPSYMAPEQARGRGGVVTTATDIYGLGAILYALIAGRPPFRGDSVLETLDRVREQAPEPPSRLNPRVDRDLETICLKCLEKDPQRRYRSADALAEDLERWLAGEPIVARPVGPLNRIRMWCRRNPRIVALALALAVALTGGVTGITWMWRRAEHQRGLLAEAQGALLLERNAAVKARDEARTSAGITEEINRFLTEDLLAAAQPEVLGKDVTIRAALDIAARRIDKAFSDRPAIEAAVRQTIGETYQSLGLLSEAESQERRALELRRRVLGGGHPDTLDSQVSLGWLLTEQGKSAEAEGLLRLALEARRRALGDEHPDTLVVMNNLALALSALGQVAEAESLLRRTIEARRRVLGPEHRYTLHAMNGLAVLLDEQRRFAESEALARQVLETHLRVRGPDHPDSLTAMNNLAALLYSLGRLAEAEPLFERSFEGSRRALGPEHPRTLQRAINLAMLRNRFGKFRQAESTFREVLQVQRRALPAGHPHLGFTLSGLGYTLLRTGQHVQAEPFLREGLEVFRATLPKGDWGAADTASLLGECLTRLGRYAEAEALLTESFEAFCKTPTAPPERVVESWERLVQLYEAWGKPDEAAKWRARRPTQPRPSRHGESHRPARHALVGAWLSKRRVPSTIPPSPEMVSGTG